MIYLYLFGTCFHFIYVFMIIGNNRESLIAEIFEERRRELMGEGWRWYDLVRRQKLMKDNEAFLRLISSGGIYWPVSEDIITANSQIEQNEFWK